MNRKTLCGVITVVSALAADATNNHAIHRVRSGGGNSTAPLTVLFMKIIIGQSWRKCNVGQRFNSR